MKVLVFGTSANSIKSKNLYDYEKAKLFQPNKELRFSVVEPASITKGVVEVVGELTNPIKRKLNVIVFPAPGH